MIMLYPSCIIISHIGPSVWLPTCEVSKNQFILPRYSETLTKLLDHLGYIDLLFIHGHQRKTSTDARSVHLISVDGIFYRSMAFASLSAFSKAQLGQVILPSSGQYSNPLSEAHMLTLRFSQWYLPHEMALRMSIYNIAQPVGAMLSGAMQGALSTNLEGALGRSGWRWAFIINVSIVLAIFDRLVLILQGVCTIFIALLAFTLLPGFVRTYFLSFPVLN